LFSLKNVMNPFFKKFRDPSRGVRALSGSLSYLETWVGSKKSFREKPVQKSAPVHPPSHHPTLANQSVHATPMTVTGQTFLVPTIKLPRNTTPETLHQSLSNAMGASPAARNLLSGKGNGVPLVVDLGEFVPDGSPHFKPLRDGELASLLTAMKQNSLHPIAITSSSGTLPNSMERIATEVGLPSVMRSAGSRGGSAIASVEEMFRVVSMRDEDSVPNVPSTPPPSPPPAPEPVAAVETPEEVEEAAVYEPEPQHTEPQHSPPPSAATPNTKIYEGHVRSGQQVSSSENGNLVILGNVSSGGEVVSDGDIHVYGKLRGRALAGLGGGNGRIYASSFDPELICVNDVFTTLEEKDRGPTMAYLCEETGELKFAPL